jgi:formyl-CoA transferase
LAWGTFTHSPRGPNDYVFVFTVFSDPMFQQLCQAMGRPELINDPRFATFAARNQHQGELTAIVNDWTGQYTKHQIMEILGEAGVPCGKVLDTLEVARDPHLCERMMVDVEHPVRGKLSIPGSPIRLEDSPLKATSAPLLGQHNDEVYKEMLGLDAQELNELRREGVI